MVYHEMYGVLMSMLMSLVLSNTHPRAIHIPEIYNISYLSEG